MKVGNNANGGVSTAESRNFMNIHSIVGASNAKSLSSSHNLTHAGLLVNDHIARMISATKEEINDDDEVSLCSSSRGNHNYHGKGTLETPPQIQ